MPISLPKLSNYLTQLNIEHLQDDALVQFQKTNETQNLTIHCQIRTNCEGNYLKFFIWTDLNEKIKDLDAKVINLIKDWMLHQNFHLKFGVWEYDALSHENHFAIEIPYEDASITFEQFARLLSILDEFEQEHEGLVNIVKGQSLLTVIEQHQIRKIEHLFLQYL